MISNDHFELEIFNGQSNIEEVNEQFIKFNDPQLVQVGRGSDDP